MSPVAFVLGCPEPELSRRPPSTFVLVFRKVRKPSKNVRKDYNNREECIHLDISSLALAALR